MNMVKVLMLRDGAEEEMLAPVFECKTCNRKFSSFQALGGHRASHKKPRLLEDGAGEANMGALAKPRFHECSVCGLEFTVGQALGGHMRRHRTKGFSHRLAQVDKRTTDKKRVPWLDLNFPPLEDGMDQWQKLQGLDCKLVDCKASMVGRFF